MSLFIIYEEHSDTEAIGCGAEAPVYQETHHPGGILVLPDIDVALEAINNTFSSYKSDSQKQAQNSKSVSHLVSSFWQRVSGNDDSAVLQQLDAFVSTLNTIHFPHTYELLKYLMDVCGTESAQVKQFIDTCVINILSCYKNSSNVLDTLAMLKYILNLPTHKIKLQGDHVNLVTSPIYNNY